MSTFYNTYIIEIVDENDNVVNSCAVHNLAYNNRYADTQGTFGILLGTMLPRDYLKYQTNGKWKAGYVEHFENGASTGANKTEVDVNEKDENGNPYYVFTGKITENDQGVWGTAVYEHNFYNNEISHDMTKSYVKCTCESLWDYHKFSSNLNQYNKTGAAETRYIINLKIADEKGLTPAQMVEAYQKAKENGGSVNGVSEVMDTPMIYGIDITDGCLIMTYGLYRTVISHFKVSGEGGALYKRPTDKVRIKVAVTCYPNATGVEGEKLNEAISLFSLGNGFKGFHREGSILYGNGALTNDCNKTPIFNPLQSPYCSLVLSGSPLQNYGEDSSIIPFKDSGGVTLPLRKFTTDKVKLPEKLKEKLSDADIATITKHDVGFPIYYVFGTGDVYKKIDDKTLAYDDYGRRIFDFKNLQPKTIVNNNRAMGPVRSVLIPGCGGWNAKDFFTEYKSYTQDNIKLKYPIKVRETNEQDCYRYYHPFGMTNGNITETVLNSASYYNTSGNLIQISNDKIVPFGTARSGFDFLGSFIGTGYFKGNEIEYYYKNYNDEKCVSTFKLNPIDKKYYVGREDAAFSQVGANVLLGRNEIMFYNARPGTYYIWLGNYYSTLWGGPGITLYKIKDEVVQERIILGSSSANFEANTITIEDNTILGIEGNFHGCMDVGGGIIYSYYDYPAIRCANSIDGITGYVELVLSKGTTAPTEIMVNVTFNIPYIDYFTKGESKFYFTWNAPLQDRVDTILQRVNGNG